jgi:hypothetical protein
MKMRKFISIFTIFLFITSCNKSTKDLRLYIKPYGQLIFFQDGKYLLNRVESNGLWRKKGRVYFLKSFYAPDKIFSISIDSSKYNNNIKTTVELYHLRTKAKVFKANIVLSRNNITDTVLYSLNDSNINIDKNKYDSIEVILVNSFPLYNSKYAYSDKFRLINSDTLKLYIDALGNSYNYKCFNNDPFIRRKDTLYEVNEYFELFK